MAQSGYTPISLYYSATGAAVPIAGNLVAGELALNTNDGKLYFKNSSGVVTLLAGSSSGPAGGSTTQVQYNNAGVLAGITGATTNGTALTLVAPVLGTPASGVVTNLTGTASININGTVGATTANTGAFTTLSSSSTATFGTYTGQSSIVTVGALNAGSITSGFGSIDIGADALTAGAGTFSGVLTLSGTAANIATGSNYISNGGTDAGLSFDVSNNATLSGGTLGIGAVQSNSWGIAAVQIGTGGFSGEASFNSIHMTGNAYITSTASAAVYATTAAASDYYQYAGGHYFRTAGSGTAGGVITFTTPVTINSTGLSVTGALSAGATSVTTLTASNVVQITGGATTPASGSGLEFSGGSATSITSFNRNGSAHLAASYNALSHTFARSGITALTIDSGGGVTAAGALSAGALSAGATSVTTLAASGLGYFGGAGTIGQLRVKQAADNFASGFSMQRAGTVDTWQYVVGGDNNLYLGYATAASGADAAADFNTVVVTSSTGLSVSGTLSATGSVTLSAASANIAAGTTTTAGSLSNSTLSSYVLVYGATNGTYPDQVQITVGGTSSRFSSTGLSVTGTLTASSMVTATALTANGAVGLKLIGRNPQNDSQVAFLQFDGTTSCGFINGSATGVDIYSPNNTKVLGTTNTGLSVTGTLGVTGAVAIGNTVAAAAAIASTHKVTMVIGGVTYYLLASNV